MLRLFCIVFTAFLFITQGCNNADFSSKGSSGDTNSTEVDEIPKTPPVVDDCTLDGEKVILNPKSQTIKDCIEAGKIYHFDWKKCTDVPKASSYDCDFDSIISHLGDKRFDTSGIETARSSSAKLIACGEKNDGDTIIVQYWEPKDGDECNFDGSGTTTACFKSYSAGEMPDAPTTEDEERALVADCIEK